MSRHNYNGYSKPQADNTKTMVEETKDVQPDEVEKTDVTPETVNEVVAAPTGVVYNCSKLNIRKEPNLFAEVIREIFKGTKVVIDKTQSTDDWLKISTENGVEGFCMKKYIAIDL